MKKVLFLASVLTCMNSFAQTSNTEVQYKENINFCEQDTIDFLNRIETKINGAAFNNLISCSYREVLLRSLYYSYASKDCEYMVEAYTAADKYLYRNQTKREPQNQFCEESQYNRSISLRCDNESLQESLNTETKIANASVFRRIKSDYRDLLMRSHRYGSYGSNCEYMKEGIDYTLDALK